MFKNSLFNIFYNVVNTIFPLLSVSYASHILLDTGIGKVSTAQNIAQYFIMLSAAGIPNYGIREIAKRRKTTEKKNKLFTELFLLNGTISIFFSLIYYILISNLEIFNAEKTLYYIVGLAIIFNILNVDWYYQGIEEYKYIALRNFFVKCVSMIILFCGVKTSDDYINYAVINVIAIAGNYLLNICNLKRKGADLYLKQEINLKQHLKYVGIFMLTNLSIELYTLLDTTMVAFFCRPENVAYYNNSIKLVKVIIIVITSISGVLLPRLSLYYKQKEYDECDRIVNDVFEIMLSVLIPSGIGIFMISDELIPILFGNSFGPAITTLQMASLLIYTLGFSNLFGTQILLTFEAEKKLLVCTIIGAVTNVTMNLLFIPRFGQNGAVVASVISEGLVTICTFIFAKRYIQLNPGKRVILVTLISAGFMWAILNFIDKYIGNKLYNLCFSILFGVTIYLLCSILLRNPLIIKINKYFRH